MKSDPDPVLKPDFDSEILEPRPKTWAQSRNSTSTPKFDFKLSQNLSLTCPKIWPNPILKLDFDSEPILNSTSILVLKPDFNPRTHYFMFSI